MSTKRKDGRLQGSVVLENPVTGKRKRFFYYGKTQEELQQRRDELITEYNRHFISGAVGFKEFCEDFLKMKLEEDKLEINSVEDYRRQLKNHVLPNLRENIEISEITPAMVKYILSTITGSNTKQYVHGLMSSIFKEAMFRGFLEKNPCDFVRRPKHKAKVADVIPQEMYWQLMDTVAGTMWEHLFRFAWSTGLRRAEICALRWTDIDYKTGIMKVEKQIKKIYGVNQVTKTKTEYSIRDIVLDKVTLEELKLWRRELSERLSECGLPFELHGYIWRKETDLSSPLFPSRITSKFQHLKEKLHLPEKIRFHSFRHTHATLLAGEEMSAKKIQARLGHASAAFTMDRYVHKSPALNDGVAAVVERITGGYRR